MENHTLPSPKARVAIYFDQPGALDYPLNYTIYFQSYSWFSDYCRENNVQVYVVRGDSYQGNMQFSGGWVFDGSDIHAVEEPIKVDLVYLKGLGIPPQFEEGSCVINNQEFDEFCGDKWRTYQLLGQYMAKTYQINNDNWHDVVSAISTEKIVLKPVTGAGGRGIMIMDKKELDYPSLELTEEAYLAQDFVDSAQGIIGLTDQVHDLRLIVFNGQVKCAYLRLPEAGKLLSNISQGAHAREVLVEEIPQSALDIVAAADANFTKYFPRIYTVDFMFEGDRPYIGELNRRPGMPHPINEGEHFTRNFYSYLLTAFVEAVEKKS